MKFLLALAVVVLACSSRLSFKIDRFLWGILVTFLVIYWQINAGRWQFTSCPLSGFLLASVSNKRAYIISFPLSLWYLIIIIFGLPLFIVAAYFQI